MRELELEELGLELWYYTVPIPEPFPEKKKRKEKKKTVELRGSYLTYFLPRRRKNRKNRAYLIGSNTLDPR